MQIDGYKGGNMTNNIKVLIIDDEVDFCYFVQKNLMQNGPFEVIIATNGKDGIELAKKEKPGIILLDLFMPDMPGEDVAAALKENTATADIPILYVTALATNDDIADSKENKIGNNYILPKPVRTKKLIEIIMKILGET
jgi:CheY-like chemotaxis protein